MLSGERATTASILPEFTPSRFGVTAPPGSVHRPTAAVLACGNMQRGFITRAVQSRSNLFPPVNPRRPLEHALLYFGRMPPTYRCDHSLRRRVRHLRLNLALVA